jgi:hypothetical protein
MAPAPVLRNAVSPSNRYGCGDRLNSDQYELSGTMLTCGRALWAVQMGVLWSSALAGAVQR